MTAAKTPLRTESLIEIFTLIVLLGFMLVGVNLLRDPGVGWHLRTGEWISAHQTVPLNDPFLFASGKNWICNQWLSDFVLWKVYAWGGFASLQVFAFVICLLPYALLAPRWSRRHNCSAPALAFAILLCMGLGMVQWYVRPVIFSFGLFAVVYKLLLDEIGGITRKHLILFPLLFIAWANLHPGFPLGLALIALAAFHCAVSDGVRADRTLRMLLLLGVSAAATIVNPRGIELHRSIFGLVSSTFFMDLNTEWLSPNFHNPLFIPLAAAIIICCIAPLRRPKLTIFESCAFGFFIYLALNGSRYVPFLGLAAITPLACALQGFFSLLESKRNFQVAEAFLNPASRAAFPVGACTALVGAILLCISFGSGRIPGWDEKRTAIDQKIPERAVAMLASARTGSRIFNNPDWGGFITWKLWPTQSAFIDDRNELNGQEHYEDYFAISRLRPTWKSVLERYNFDFLLIEKSAPAYTALAILPDWKVTFEDDALALFEKIRT